MTTRRIRLSDGTLVARRYDFNEHFPALPLHDQATDPTCWYQSQAAQGEADYRMYEGKAIRVDPKTLHVTQDGPTGQIVTSGSRTWRTDYSGMNVWDDPAFAGLSRKEAVIKALYLNGIAEVGVSCRNSFNHLWRRPDQYPSWNGRRLTEPPVLHPLDGDRRNLERIRAGLGGWSHDTIGVGYDFDLGILDQNSWGPAFGCKGRAYLGWDMLDEGLVDGVFVRLFNDHPLNGLVMPPRRTG